MSFLRSQSSDNLELIIEHGLPLELLSSTRTCVGWLAVADCRPGPLPWDVETLDCDVKCTGRERGREGKRRKEGRREEAGLVSDVQFMYMYNTTHTTPCTPTDYNLNEQSQFSHRQRSKHMYN